MKRILLSAALFAALSAPLSAMNGFSVTTVWRLSYYAGIPEDNIPMMCDYSMNVGALIKANISSNQVTGTDTLLSMTTACCQYPAIRLDGKKIAFFRWPFQIQNGKMVNLNNGYHISVVDATGNNLTDIVTVPRRPGKIQPLDWPADGWIYYAMPSDVSTDPIFGQGYEVWKVNPNATNPASTNVKVMSLASNQWRIWRFSLALNTQRGAFDASCYTGCTSKLVAAVQWPGTTDLGGSGSCNCKISASGNIIAAYGGGAHDQLNMASWNGTRMTDYPSVNRIAFMADNGSIFKAFQRAGFDMGSQAGCEQLIFASNSDKWVTQQVYWFYSGARRGSNQLITNWYEKQALFGTRNPAAPPNAQNAMDIAQGQFAWHAACGDVWIQPPAGASDWAYEDTLKWNSLQKPSDITDAVRTGVGVQTTHRMTVSQGTDGFLNVRMPDASNRYLVQVLDIAGRIIASHEVTSSVRMNMPRMSGAVRLVRASIDGAVTASETILVY
jgi:hypothetical protein